jgi:hypothetical protein
MEPSGIRSRAGNDHGSRHTGRSHIKFAYGIRRSYQSWAALVVYTRHIFFVPYPRWYVERFSLIQQWSPEYTERLIKYRDSSRFTSSFFVGAAAVGFCLWVQKIRDMLKRAIASRHTRHPPRNEGFVRHLSHPRPRLTLSLPPLPVSRLRGTESAVAPPDLQEPVHRNLSAMGINDEA